MTTMHIARPPRIHPTADVSERATIGSGAAIWNGTQVREHASIGRNCILGKDVYVDAGVSIGDNTKIQNRASIYHGTTIASGVFIGPHVVFTNDKQPRAINPDGSLKNDDDWIVLPISVGMGASIGAGSIILPGVTIGRFALIGAGSLVSRDVPELALVYGNPARLAGFVCVCAQKLTSDSSIWTCSACGQSYADAGGAPRLADSIHEATIR